MKGFYRTNVVGWARELPVELFGDQDTFSSGEEKGKGVYHVDCLFFL